MLSRASRPAARWMLQPNKPAAICQQQTRVALRRQTPRFHGRRFQSTGTGGNASAAGNPALIGGLAGGASAVALGYLWYHFSGAKNLVKASKKTDEYITSAKKKVADSVKDVEPSKALEWLRNTTLSYTAFIPGVNQYVNQAFDDIDKIRENHGDEVDSAVSDAVSDLKKIVNKKGASVDALWEASDVIREFFERVGSVAGDAAEDILENHPQLKEKLGGPIDQLKQMSESYGPEIKEEVDNVWKQIQDLYKSSSATEAYSKAQELVQEKLKKLRELSDEAWKKGLEQAKPYLDKNPKIKELIEENKDALKSGNLSQLWELTKKASESGDTKDIEKFVKDKASKVSDSGAGVFDSVMKAIPGSDELIAKLKKLQSVAEKKSPEAQKLLKETAEEIQAILKKKADQAKDIVDKAEKEAK